jgi:hypothetical protein
LAENSRLQLASVGSELSANLTSGSMRYSLSSGSKLRVLQGGTPLVGRSGDVSGSSSNKVGSTKSQSFLFSPPPPPPGPISAR